MGRKVHGALFQPLNISHHGDFSLLAHAQQQQCNNGCGGVQQSLGGLLRSLRDKAAGGDSRRKYATDTAIVASFQTIYGLMQCTPDLSRQNCADCLDWTISSIRRVSKDRLGAVSFQPSCNVRYEIYPFYDPTIILDPAPPPASLSLHQGKFHSYTYYSYCYNFADILVRLFFHSLIWTCVFTK